MGDAREAAAYLASRGCTRAFDVNACGFNRRRKTMMGTIQGGEKVYIVEYGFYTDDQLLNHEARVYFLRRGRGPAVDRNIETLRRPGAALPVADAVERFLKELGEPVRVFFVGFSTPLKRHLVEQRLVRIGDIELRVGRLPLSERDRPLVIALSGFGANYGTLPARLLGHLARRGLRAVVAVGTGGGLHRGITRRFGWVAPSRIFHAGAASGADSPEIVVDNAAAGLRLPGAVSYARHATVPTVLAETQPRIGELRYRRTLSVDCEQYHLASFLRRHAPSVIFYGLVNITDFPMGDESERASAGPGITLENSPDQAKAVEEALTRIIDDLRRRFR